MRGLEDHRGVVGRSAWVIFAGLISVGFAGILAIILVMRDAVDMDATQRLWFHGFWPQ